ncbi:hypothetical protein ECC02_011567 [Trypanosoma cruzi]|uniref:Uncharacterized protein n=1 Tax=Trypanosoma cruzi TaxID=5693 RepID=A0A7J6XMG9_TRYCR|nr:hypothetical protein ECC02_012397 [Trypanosoma cruzi]KAF5215719.1 hypothetical protein ECC02_011567 [Trypanosoma cruzi]
MRRGQQPGMHRTPHTTHNTHSNPRQQAHTHTHSPAATTTHRWKREKQTGAAHKAPPHAHTARAVRRVGTPHGGYAHTQEEVQRTQQHKSKVTIKKERSPHTTRIVGPREVQPIFITRKVQLPSAFVHIQRTPLYAGPATTAAAAHAKISARNGIMQAIIYLRFGSNAGICPHALFCFSEGKPSCLHRVLGISAGCTICLSFLL